MDDLVLNVLKTIWYQVEKIKTSNFPRCQYITCAAPGQSLSIGATLVLFLRKVTMCIDQLTGRPDAHFHQ